MKLKSAELVAAASSHAASEPPAPPAPSNANSTSAHRFVVRLKCARRHTRPLRAVLPLAQRRHQLSQLSAASRRRRVAPGASGVRRLLPRDRRAPPAHSSSRRAGRAAAAAGSAGRVAAASARFQSFLRPWRALMLPAGADTGVGVGAGGGRWPTRTARSAAATAKGRHSAVLAGADRGCAGRLWRRRRRQRRATVASVGSGGGGATQLTTLSRRSTAGQGRLCLPAAQTVRRRGGFQASRLSRGDATHGSLGGEAAAREAHGSRRRRRRPPRGAPLPLKLPVRVDVRHSLSRRVDVPYSPVYRRVDVRQARMRRRVDVVRTVARRWRRRRHGGREPADGAAAAAERRVDAAGDEGADEVAVSGGPKKSGSERANNKGVLPRRRGDSLRGRGVGAGISGAPASSSSCGLREAAKGRVGQGTVDYDNDDNDDDDDIGENIGGKDGPSRLMSTFNEAMAAVAVGDRAVVKRCLKDLMHEFRRMER